MAYQIVDTNTGKPAIERTYESLHEARVAMMSYFPLVPWDGIDVPIGIVEVPT